MSVPYYWDWPGIFGRSTEPKSPHKRHESYLIIHSLHYENRGFPLSLTNRDVARISELARLELTPAEADLALGQLNSVLGLIEALQAVDTTGVAPMTHAGDLALRLRPDAVTEPDRRDDYQRSAPAVDHGLYLVPRVIE
jgi:aspartyl-tRNA(Asn)/glutamyl-tRNA(Gln) amidotransferase subunit C